MARSRSPAAGARRHAWLQPAIAAGDGPGVEQKATWLQVRQSRPDYVLLWGWGVMNSTALKEAQATGYPREKMYGVWWSGAEPDVKDVGMGAKGYNAVTMQHGAEPNSDGRQGHPGKVHGKGQGTGPKEEVGQVLYMRGAMSAMLAVEGVRAAQERFGKGKWMSAEQARWGYENLNLTRPSSMRWASRGVMRPDLHQLRRPHGFQAGPGCTPGTARSGSSRPTGCRPTSRSSSRMVKAGCRQVRGREEADPRTGRTASPDERPKPAPRLQWPARARRLAGPSAANGKSGRGWPFIGHCNGSPMSTADIVLNVNGIEVIYNHVILVLKGVSLQVPEGKHRRHPGRQRRRQDDHAARHLQPAQGRAWRGHQGLDRAARRTHREPLARRPGATRRGAGDGGAALFRPPDDRGEPDDRRLHPQGQGRDRAQPGEGLHLLSRA
jgi:hypothetical protein